MLSFAGGLAREGFKPHVHTFAVFIYRRAYDQIAMSVAYPNLPVKMFGFLPGVLTPGGATHQAIEDISIMRSLPNIYGKDVIFLIGGGLFKIGPDLVENSRHFRELVDKFFTKN